MGVSLVEVHWSLVERGSEEEEMNEGVWGSCILNREEDLSTFQLMLVEGLS